MRRRALLMHVQEAPQLLTTREQVHALHRRSVIFILNPVPLELHHKLHLFVVYNLPTRQAHRRWIPFLDVSLHIMYRSTAQDAAVWDDITLNYNVRALFNVAAAGCKIDCGKRGIFDSLRAHMRLFAEFYFIKRFMIRTNSCTYVNLTK